MAKRVVKWFLNKAEDASETDKPCVLGIGKYSDDKKAEVLIEAKFDLTKIYENFKDMTDVQQQLIIFGTKQKLMDTGAGSAEPASKIVAAKEKWDELIAGKWTGERTNATGAAEAKAAISNAKEAMKVVSLEGLIVKKTLYPNTFTEEDQKKLDEFLGLAKASEAKTEEKHGKKNNK